MIYYDFSKFQPIYYKRTLRNTIYMSHILRRKPPGLYSIAAGGPWAEIETKEAHRELDSGDGGAHRRRWRGG